MAGPPKKTPPKYLEGVIKIEGVSSVMTRLSKAFEDMFFGK